MRLFMTTALLATATAAAAEQSISFYGGVQEVANSTANVRDIDGSTYDFDASWEGHSLDAPQYYGLRYTNWVGGDYGYAIDFVHSKAYSTADTRANSGYDVLEFTDGINVLTVNALRRFNAGSKIRPYVGAGLGLAIPHVELQSPQMSEPELGYQIGGLAATAFAGSSYAINDTWSVFGEVKFDYAMLDVDMGDGGTFETDLLTNAINFGVAYSF